MHLLVGKHTNKQSSKSRCNRASGQRFNTTGHPALPGGFFCTIGNPLNDGTWTYTWQNGRQLKKMQKSGETVEFVYNENGLRVQKTATSTGVTKCTLHGKNIVHMTQGSNELHFFYDAQNKPAVVVYNGTPYSYAKNLQGDIVAILDSAGSVVVQYKYDAWGKPISKTGSMASTLGTVQPFRYRGYVYDEETGLYYLRSRYYNPNWCRFVNADTLILINNKPLCGNVFAYCCNQAIRYTDANGYGPDQIAESDDPDEDFFPTEGGSGGAQRIAQSVLQGGNAFSSYGAFKYRHGKAGLGMHWHHLVEQCQIKLSNISTKLIYSVQNTIALDVALHHQISGFYSSIQEFTNGLTVRKWLSTMTFDEQYAWGLKFLDQILHGD